MIIDCHTHLNRYPGEPPSTLEERYRRLRADMDRNGIDYALVLSSYRVTEDRPSVQDIIHTVKDDPRIGVVAGVSYHHYRAQDLAELRTLLRGGQIRALKLYPGYEAFYVHDPRMRVVYELAGEFQVPVMIHTGDTYDPKGKLKYAHPLEVDEVAVDFRDVTFVICHLGNPWFVDAMEVIYKNENVVGDISGLTLGQFSERFESFMLAQLHDVLAYAGDPSSLLFGTDWPICEVGSYIRFVRQLDLTEEEIEQILWKNSARVFRLDLEPREGGPRADA
ncbi:MAG: amidohydrolase family protein [Gemmatimonadota bacterium]|nr:amidohydrolase family protein [Gemmatimonadota bacterium]